MEFNDIIKDLDLIWHDCDDNFESMPGMVVIYKDFTFCNGLGVDLLEYAIVGSFLPAGRNIVDSGCGCCSEPQKPIMWAWIREELDQNIEA